MAKNKKKISRITAVKRSAKRTSTAVIRLVGSGAKKLAVKAVAEIMFGASDRARVRRMTK